MTSNGGCPNNTYLRIHYIHFWKQQTEGDAMLKKTNDLKQEFSIEKDKYEKYEASVDLTADE